MRIRALNVESSGHSSYTLRCVLNINRVVPAVGTRNREEHQEPAPEAELALLGQRLGEHEVALLDDVVGALGLPDAVHEHVERGLRAVRELDQPLSLHPAGYSGATAATSARRVSERRIASRCWSRRKASFSGMSTSTSMRVPSASGSSRHSKRRSDTWQEITTRSPSRADSTSWGIGKSG